MTQSSAYAPRLRLGADSEINKLSNYLEFISQKLTHLYLTTHLPWWLILVSNLVADICLCSVTVSDCAECPGRALAFWYSRVKFPYMPGRCPKSASSLLWVLVTNSSPRTASGDLQTTGPTYFALTPNCLLTGSLPLLFLPVSQLGKKLYLRWPQTPLSLWFLYLWGII